MWEGMVQVHEETMWNTSLNVLIVICEKYCFRGSNVLKVQITEERQTSCHGSNAFGGKPSITDVEISDEIKISVENMW